VGLVVAPWALLPFTEMTAPELSVTSPVARMVTGELSDPCTKVSEELIPIVTVV
jgi:hypothetical protein